MSIGFIKFICNLSAYKKTAPSNHLNSDGRDRPKLFNQPKIALRISSTTIPMAQAIVLATE